MFDISVSLCGASCMYTYIQLSEIYKQGGGCWKWLSGFFLSSGSVLLLLGEYYDDYNYTYAGTIITCIYDYGKPSVQEYQEVLNRGPRLSQHS